MNTTAMPGLAAGDSTPRPHLDRRPGPLTALVFLAVLALGLALAWVLTMPAAVLLSGSLYWLFSRLF